MALYVKQQEQRSQLQDKLAAELQERAKLKAAGELPDGVEDSRYIENTRQTSRLAWLWGIVALAAVGAVIWLVIQASS